MVRLRQRAFCLVLSAVFVSAVSAAERELDRDTPPSSAGDIKSPIERTFPTEREQVPLLPQVRERIKDLDPFIADSAIDVRYRTYYLRKDRVSDILSEAWAMGGSLSVRSGWFEDAFAVEVEGFTSQPIVAPSSRDGTLLLEFGQKGYTALGIANGKLRYKGIVLTGGRQYLDLPYVNRNDSRMTPNTFESVTLAKPDGNLRFSTGYTWTVKTRTEDDFRSFTEVAGADVERGLVHGGAVWDPSENFHVGAIAGIVPDLFGGIYSELAISRDLAAGVEARLDGQFTLQFDTGDDLLGHNVDDTWSLGLRASTSYAGALLRLGVSLTGPGGAIFSLFGTNPSYVDLMQRSFTREDERALLMSGSYDFAQIGFDGLKLIVNAVAGFDGRLITDIVDGTLVTEKSNAQEIDVTLDYRIDKGWLRSFWLRLRGSWLNAEGFSHDGSDFRVIVRYDFPVI